jgi:membrane-associated phospholipid phosphatase
MPFFNFSRMLVFCLLFATSCWAQSLSEKKPTPLTFSEQHVYPFFKKAIDTHSQFVLATGTIAVLLVRPGDDNSRDHWKSHQQMSKDTAHVGDLMGSGALGVLSLGAQYFFDEDRDHWMSSGRGLVWSTLINGAMKVGFSRPRPGGSKDRLSFPSGHTTTIFTTATSLSLAYGWKAAVVAYPIAAFVGLSRLADDAHWGSDVVGGAFLGYWVARASFYSFEEAEAVKYQSVFLPVISPEQLGLSWTYSY